MPADSFADPVFFNAELCDEQVTPVDDFLRQLRAVSDEMNEITQTEEGCDQYLADHDKIMSAAININLACHRIAARAKATRINRRLIEIV